jgi:multiple antibiotic resistance protein
MQNWKSYAEIAIALFVLLDPIGAVPVFVTLTANNTPDERKRTIDRAATTAFIVLMIALLVGDPHFTFWGSASRRSLLAAALSS